MQAPIVAEIYGPDDAGRLKVAEAVRTAFLRAPGLADVDASYISAAPRQVVTVDRQKAALLGVSDAEVVATLRAGIAGQEATFLQDASKYPAPLHLQLADSTRGSLDAVMELGVRAGSGAIVPLSSLVTVRETTVEQPRYHKDLLPVVYVTGDESGRVDSPLYGMFGLRAAIGKIVTPDGGRIAEYFIRQPSDPYRGYALKWDGEWQITYETFRDMGAAYAVGLVLIYLLVVAQFGSYLTPLIIMAPIPLTIIGVMPGHALLHSQFTATSMIGMIALAGIIVRNSILLVDFINLQVATGVEFREAVIRSAITRAQPIVLTALAAMLGAFFILDDPIFNGLAISLIFGILVSTVLTLVVIPLLYYAVYRQTHAVRRDPDLHLQRSKYHDFLATHPCRRRHIHPAVAGARCACQPDVPQRQLAVVHGLCWHQPAAEWADALVPDGAHPARPRAQSQRGLSNSSAANRGFAMKPALLFVFLMYTTTAGAAGISVTDAWQAAMRHDPAFEAARAQWEAGRTHVAQARALWLPTLSAQGSAGSGDQATHSSGAAFSAPGFGSTNGVDFQTSVNGGTARQWAFVAEQPLFDASRKAGVHRTEELRGHGRGPVRAGEAGPAAAHRTVLFCSAQQSCPVRCAEASARGGRTRACHGQRAL